MGGVVLVFLIPIFFIFAIFAVTVLSISITFHKTKSFAVSFGQSAFIFILLYIVFSLMFLPYMVDNRLNKKNFNLLKEEKPIMDKAIDENNFSLCLVLTKKDLRSVCANNLAILNNDSSMCDIVEYPDLRENCFELTSE